jgi:hypothetical protein
MSDSDVEWDFGPQSSCVMAKLEKWLIVLIALHSIGVGTLLLATPRWAVSFAGWEEVDPLFFPCQAGVFHIVLGMGYLIEYFRYRGIVLLVAAKSVALVFLLTTAALVDGPWSVPFCGIADGVMGVVAYTVHRIAAARGRQGGVP